MAKVYASGDELGGKVRIDAMLHIAGFGITYKAQTISDSKTVLVKQLQADPKSTNGHVAAQRFRREQSITPEYWAAMTVRRVLVQRDGELRGVRCA